jgi:hypothetical protein
MPGPGVPLAGGQVEVLMTADEFRELALALDGAVEHAHMGHPDFRANGRIFASLHSQDTKGMVKLAPDEQRELLRTNPETFEPSAGAWGRQGCTNVILTRADAAAVRGALLLAWHAIRKLKIKKGKEKRNAETKNKAKMRITKARKR